MWPFTVRLFGPSYPQRDFVGITLSSSLTAITSRSRIWSRETLGQKGGAAQRPHTTDKARCRRAMNDQGSDKRGGLRVAPRFRRAFRKRCGRFPKVFRKLSGSFLKAFLKRFWSFPEIFRKLSESFPEVPETWRHSGSPPLIRSLKMNFNGNAHSAVPL